MELLEGLAGFDSPNEIGSGVYDIHTWRVPTVEEVTHLLEKGAAYGAPWSQPGRCLKTRA
jgi:5-methyltetrahydropteroyltriglutamate--homocysteine methyltransferase